MSLVRSYKIVLIGKSVNFHQLRSNNYSPRQQAKNFGYYNCVVIQLLLTINKVFGVILCLIQ